VSKRERRRIRRPEVDESVSMKIAFFDFDGTITTRDSLIDFLSY
jgi:hypothetical protein